MCLAQGRESRPPRRREQEAVTSPVGLASRARPIRRGGTGMQWQAKVWLLGLLPVVAGAAPPQAPRVTGAARPEARLTEGKFGKALDAAVTPQAFGGDARYRTPPLTVECWARLNSKRGFNVLVSCDPKSSAQHWEIYSYARSGVFSAYLPGYEPSEVLSKQNICDRKWHHVAMTFDGKQVRLHVDGKLVREQAVKPRAGMKTVPGPLSIGQAIDGSNRIGCDRAIDEVRISRVLLGITPPTAAS